LLSSSSTAKIAHALNHAWADSTLSKYCSVIAQFQSFCDHENIPPQLCIPASEHLLCAFAASRVGALAGDTVQTHLAAIKAWHIYNNKPWRGSPCLCYVLNGIANLAPSFSKKASSSSHHMFDASPPGKLPEHHRLLRRLLPGCSLPCNVVPITPGRDPLRMGDILQASLLTKYSELWNRNNEPCISGTSESAFRMSGMPTSAPLPGGTSWNPLGIDPEFM
ncbi:hypothetical protein BS17DRAFT_828884, partial [Gyrodon lividus]